MVRFSRIDEVIPKLESLTAAEAVFEARVKSGSGGTRLHRGVNVLKQNALCGLEATIFINSI